MQETVFIILYKSRRLGDFTKRPDRVVITAGGWVLGGVDNDGDGFSGEVDGENSNC